MLPRVPVSQRHSRASFCTRRNVVTDCRKGTIKRSRSLSFPHARIRTYLYGSRYCTQVRRTGRTVCTYACAREGVLFSASLGARHNLSRATPPREGRRAVNRGNATGREREREKEKGASPPPFPLHSRVYRGAFLFLLLYTRTVQFLWNLVE